MDVRFRLLGEVSARVGGSAVELGHARQRCVLAALLVDANRLVPVGQLIDRIWSQRPPAAARNTLAGYVSRLRQLLAPAGDLAIARRVDGYLVRVDPMAVDLHLFHHLTRQARDTDDTGQALATYERALALWRGEPFAGLDTQWLSDVRVSLDAERLEAELDRNELALSRGRHRAPLGELLARAAAHPLHERLAGQLMLALYGSGRQAEALHRYERLRLSLAEELGADPSPPLQHIHRRILGDHHRPPLPASPEVRYARSGLVNIAYQVVSEGPVDLVVVPGWVSNVELNWEEPRMAAFLRRLALMSRLILFDKRGTGLSDPIPIDAPPDLEVRMDDLDAVLDAAGSHRAVLLGLSEGGTMSLLFAASRPERTTGLVLWGSWVRQRPTTDFPLGITREEGLRRFVRPLQATGVVDSRWFAPSVAGDPDFERWYRRYARQSASPGMAIALLKANAAMDIRPVLPAVRVPALVLHRSDDVLVEVGHGRHLAAHLPDARYVELSGRDHWPWFGDTDAVLAAVAAFLDDVKSGRPADLDGVLATVVAVHDNRGIDPARVADRLGRYRGVLVDLATTRLVARFDGPTRAVRYAATEAREGASAGVHTGEITARTTGGPTAVADELAARAAPGRVLVTSTVIDLTPGSGLPLTEYGHAELPDLPGCRLFTVAENQ